MKTFRQHRKFFNEITFIIYFISVSVVTYYLLLIKILLLLIQFKAH